MEPYFIYLNNLANRNRKQFEQYPALQWMNSSRAINAQKKKDNLSAKLSRLFKDTKPYHNQLSEGCRLCGSGTWSCLFITNKCNAKCFYCPSAQTNDEIPATQSLTFSSPESYAAYINHFGFKGVSFSGGEPLLFFERTLEYLRAIRKHCQPDIYIWMYTNGILATEEKFRQLAEAGLNEVRFDIGATGYRLDKLKHAKGIIPNITIEIPAVPERKELLKQLLPEMEEAGVTNLNLHQLRLTKYNASKLVKHNYTYIQAEQPVVLESELTALEIIKTAGENHSNIGINYCSFYYKNRYQSSGFRKILAKASNVPEDKITERGYIRYYNGQSIGYTAMVLTELYETNTQLQKLELADKTCGIKIETAMPTIQLTSDQKAEVDRLLCKEPVHIPSEEYLFKIWQMEYIEKGIREY